VTNSPVIALIPLDERPVNTGLVRDVAAVAGGRLVLPPDALLPRFREPADVDGLGRWLSGIASGLDAAVVAVDTLVHGGLIPSRTSNDLAASALVRLERLRELHAAHPRVRLAAVSVVTRASDSYSPVEEPDYWASVGRELHALGGAVHRSWAGIAGAAEPAVPPATRDDYSRRRLRNHLVGLASLGLAWDGVLDPLIITADDTATWSAGSAEQHLLDYWQRLRGGERVLVYPGADETGAVLTARLLLADLPRRLRVAVVPGDPAGMALVPSYENAPLELSVGRQLAALGAEAVTRAEDADLVLVVHTPDPSRADHFAIEPPPEDPAAVELTRRAVVVSLESRRPVALADLRYGNGGDSALVDALAADGTLGRLEAYAGWNTAGNALGSVLALALAAAAGRARGTLDEAARERALRRRIADDVLFQARLRRPVSREVFGDRIEPAASEVVARAEALLTSQLREALERILPGEPIGEVTLPWARSFEVGIRFHGESA